MRELSRRFLDDLMREDGLLHPILERVKQDHTLMLAIRDGYINVYYRGGNLLKVECNGADSSYKTFFDPRYDKSGQRLPPALPATMKQAQDVTVWIAAFPHLKEIMDFHSAGHNKPEREFQQLVARENNSSSISNETEYFITDIEFTEPGFGARFDMLAIRWLVSERKDRGKCRAALIEMKYGDHALNGNAGLLDHLRDIDQFISDETRYRSLLDTMEAQFRQLDQLGLLRFNRCKNGTELRLRTEDKPEVIFILANHNPRYSALGDILDDPQIVAYRQSPRFDLKFAVTRFAGYGLHADGLFSLSEFRQLLREPSGVELPSVRQGATPGRHAGQTTI